MTFFLLLLLFILLYKVKFFGPGEFNSKYIDKTTTTSISGIFVILVVFSHFVQYLGDVTLADIHYFAFRTHMKQLVVVPFLFYTGYGMMESFKRKGSGYIKALPGKFFKLLFRFDAAVLLFWILALMQGKHYKIGTVLLAMTGWRPIRNSNWYIFDILVLYLLMYIAFSIDDHFSRGGSHILGTAVLSILVMGFVYLLMTINMPSRYYNTIFTACVGCWYSLMRSRIEKVVMKNDIVYCSITALIIAAYIWLSIHVNNNHIETYTLWTIAFAGMMILLTMKINIDNDILRFFGSHVFSIYILQRIPMTILHAMGLIEAHKYLSLILVFALTIPFALAFEKVTGLIIDRFIGITSAPEADRSAS